MNKKFFRIIIGLIWIIVGILNLVTENLSWWYSALSFLIGAVFLYSAFKQNKEG